MTDQIPTNDITSDDKLWALLAYGLTPLIPIIILLMEDKKNRPFIKAHNAQALMLGIAFGIIATILSVTVILACVAPFLWLVGWYYGYQAYQGKEFDIPVITNFVKNQGWA